MTKEEKELTITYLTKMQEEYIEGEGYERYPLPEYYALDMAIKALEQQPSDDCVSREQAVKAMTDWYFDMLEKGEGRDFINILDALPPVTPTQSWIPVSEKLPEVGEKVLCQCQANIYDVLKLTADGWYYDNRHCYMSGFVIAWQPLPKPYEEKRGNEE